MAKVVTVPADGTLSVNDITDNANRFLSEVYTLIGNGCDFVEAVNLGDGMYLLVDEEPFRRNPEPPVNTFMPQLLAAIGCRPISVKGAGVFVGETADGSDLAGLTDQQITTLTAARDTVSRIRH
jgi:hypothetical protein